MVTDSGASTMTAPHESLPRVSNNNTPPPLPPPPSPLDVEAVLAPTASHAGASHYGSIEDTTKSRIDALILGATDKEQQYAQPGRSDDEHTGPAARRRRNFPSNTSHNHGISLQSSPGNSSGLGLTSLRSISNPIRATPTSHATPRYMQHTLASRQPSGFQEIRARFNNASSVGNLAIRPSTRSVSAHQKINGTSTSAPNPNADQSHAGGPLSSSSKLSMGHVLYPSIAQHDDYVSSTPLQSQSHSQSEHVENRQQLFGEVVETTPQSLNVPDSASKSSQHRRGSEGSMHLPNAMFPQGKTKTADPSDSLSNGWNSSPNLLDSPESHQKQSVDLQCNRSESPGSTRSSRPNSRIPISKRRSSFTDGAHQTSGSNVQLNTQLNSQLSEFPTVQENQVIKPAQRPATPPILLTSKRYEPRQNTVMGNRQAVKAVISVPTAKESPPLRRSRPHRSISSASGHDATKSFSTNQEAKLDQPTNDMQFDKSLIESTNSKSSVIPVNDGNQTSTSEASQSKDSIYANPPPQLKLDVSQTHDESQQERYTSGTEFEEGGSPSLKMPGTFLVSPRSSNPSPTPGAFVNAVDHEPVESASGQPEDSATLDDSEDEPVQFLPNIRSVHEQSPIFANLESGGEDSLDQDDKETIQIMLGTSTNTPYNGHGWHSGHSGHSTIEKSGEYIHRDQNTAEESWQRENSSNPFDTQGETAAGQVDDGAAWNPNQSVRSNIENLKADDDYGLINRILDQHYESGGVTPEMIHEFQKDILDKTPDISVENSYEIARVAIQDVIRDHSGRLPRLTQSTSNDKRNVIEYGFNRHDKNGTSNRGNIPLDAEAIYNSNHGRISDINLQSKYYRQAGGSTLSDRKVNRDRHERDSDDDRHRPTPPPKSYRLSPSLGTNPQTISDSSQYKKESRSASRSRQEAENGPRLPDITPAGSLGLGIQNEASQDSTVMLSPVKPGSQVTAQSLNSTETVSNFTNTLHDSYRQNYLGIYPVTPSDGPQVVGRTSNPNFARDTAASNTALHSNQSQDTITSSATFDRTTSRATPSPTPEDQKRLNKRKETIRELVWTEHTYSNDMRIVEDIYKKTSRTQDVLSDDDQRVLFGNSQQVLAFSELFLAALKQGAASVYTLSKDSRWRQQAVNPTSDQSSMTSGEQTDEEQDRKTFIGEAFLKHLSQLEKVFGEYLKNQDAANQRLQKIQGLPKVTMWLKECNQYSKGLTQAWNLDSLMVKPVQRMLKYPLLLTALLETTPKDHPDYSSLENAHSEMLAISHRINDSKKRADLVEQVVNRKRKDSESRLGLSKAFGRRTEKLKQQVGLSDAYEDSDYKAISAKFGGQFFQLQVAMRDVEKYLEDVQTFVDSYNNFVIALEGIIDAGQSVAPEAESRWRRFAVTIRDITTIALPDHKNAVRKLVIDPMVTALKLHENPQKLMAKRKKRIVDYAKYKSVLDRGDKPDRKTQEQGEQYLALNDTLKEEFPKLFALSAKLVAACLCNLIDLQAQWDSTWERKLRGVLEEESIPKDLNDIITSFNADFKYPLAQAMSMGVCNGSLLAEPSNLLTPATTNDDASFKGYSTWTTTKRTSDSTTAPLDSNQRNSGNYQSYYHDLPRRSGESLTPLPYDQTYQRYRRESLSRPPPTPTGQNRSAANSSSSAAYFPKSSNNQQRYTDPPPQGVRLSSDSNAAPRPTSTSTYYTANITGLPPVQLSTRLSGVFSSAMPMSESPTDTRSTSPDRMSSESQKVLFLAASLFEFNIDRARKEGGYPYLTYTPGEVFDVIGEKGELWLAKNQDDPTGTLGWIWEKHFAKLMNDDG